TPFVRADGDLDYRCPAEPAAMYQRKGGRPQNAQGRLCLCNGLMANVGLGQTRGDGYVEPALVTLGANVSGALELSGDAWSKHHGEIRVIIAHPFQKRGLGTVMIRELYFIAVQNQIQTIVARMMRPQVGAQKIFRRLGFREESMMPDFVKDLQGSSQDLIVMTCDVKELWKQLDRTFSESDWQRCRD
ncbi:MAG: GNAT family N-acetyltransferase, partial [Candidatus Aminicenantes bacterium]|nr:GNAT family N-acetyltransferase [Candidatus Aminicenantes bacterium]